MQPLLPPDVPDHWDFYPCRVDDAPASIFLNMWFAGEIPLEDAPHLYWCSVQMKHPDTHGMGSQEEAESFYDLEETYCAAAQELGCYYVGRLRNHGAWQLTFYGQDGMGERLAALAAKIFPSDRDIEIGGQIDEEWEYYSEFLFPDGERLQWMQDAKVVSVLQENGDSLLAPRRVDHWLYFASPGTRQSFLDGALALGFEIEQLHGEGDPPLKFCAQVHRVDAVELDHIHGVVMELSEIAERHGGEYDGWETSVESA